MSSDKPTRAQVQSVVTTTDPDVFREVVADHVHWVWQRWQSYVHDVKGIRNEDGSVTIPAELVERWDRQIATNYPELPEDEKKGDRETADEYLVLFRGFYGAAYVWKYSEWLAAFKQD